MTQASEISAEPSEPQQAAERSDAPAGGGDGRGTRTLGLVRWVQYVFIVAAAFLLWFLDKVVTLVWARFAEPNTTAITAGSAIAAAAIALYLYRDERAHRVASEVVGELAKVTWPSRKETSAATMVVIVTSLIAAAVVGGFDFVWSAITDLLYKYKV